MAADFDELWLRGDTDFPDGTLTSGIRNEVVRIRRAPRVALAGKSRRRLAAGGASGRYEIGTEPRTRPENGKERIVREREYKNIRLESEQVAEFVYQPGKCQKGYRMVVVRKNLSVEKGEQVLFDDIRYFFYLTNDTSLSATEIVFFANQRCDQENVIEQLKKASMRCGCRRRPGVELGLHGDGGVGVEPEKLVRADGAGPGRGPCHCANGVQALSA